MLCFFVCVLIREKGRGNKIFSYSSIAALIRESLSVHLPVRAEFFVFRLLSYDVEKLKQLLAVYIKTDPISSF